MLFSSPIFLFGFLPLVLALYFFAARSLRARNAVLLSVSLLFYAWGELTFVLVLLASIAFNHALGARIERTGRRRLWAAVAIALNIGLLAVFKYAAFAVQTWNGLAVDVGLGTLPVPDVHLPLGISFFTFQALTYVIDVYRRDVRASPSLFHTALYISLFPQLIAGPIVRYGHVTGQLVARTVGRRDVAHGIERFVVGLAKKVLIANQVAVPADAIFGLPASELGAGLAWLGVVCYTLQIYFDFSGYSDMAIGLGRMFGLHFPENFDYPYVARSIREFWRRWHISLSTWFRDYLYIPLGGNRGTTWSTARNLLVVFFLCGLWHGAAWTFIVWGLYHGAFLAAERTRFGRLIASAPRPLQHAYALAVVTVGWIIFRADDLGHALGFVATLAGAGTGAGVVHPLALYLTADVIFWVAVGALWSTPLPSAVLRSSALSGRAEPVATLLGPLAVGLLFVASASALAAGTYNPFIYFRF